MGEVATSEEAVGEEAGHAHQRRRGGQAERQAEHHRLVHGRLGVVVILLLQGGRQARQQRHADRHPDEGERQLVEALGHRQPHPHPRHLAGQGGRDEQVDLGGAGGQHAGRHAPGQHAHLRRQLQRPRIDSGAGPVRAPPAHPRLHDPGDDGAPGRRVGGLQRVVLGQDRHERHDVYERRIEAVNDKPPAGGQHAGEQRGDHHARQVGHGDGGEDDGELELRRRAVHRRQARSRAVAEAVDVHDPRHRQLADHRQGDGERRHGRQRVRGVAVRALLALPGQPLGILRHEGRGEGAFGEHAAEQVGELLGAEIGVAGEVGAQLGGDHQVAGQTQEPADQRQRREDRRGSQHAAPALGGRLVGARGLGHRGLVGCVGEDVNIPTARYRGVWNIDAGAAQGRRLCRTYSGGRSWA